MKKLYYVISLIILLTVTGCGIEKSTSFPIEESVLDEQETDTSKNESEFPRTKVSVTRVIDGDTIKAIINGKEESLRFLLVDTPETNHPRMSGPQPFGKEAKEFVEELLKDGTVEIEMDVGERDRYGRLLAYLYVEGESVQEALLQRGLARVAYIYPPNTRYVDQFQAIQKEAQNNAIGIWSVENYAQEDGFYPEFVEEPTPKKQETKLANCHIKGNISSSGEKIYHMPNGMYYERTNPEECFDTEKEATDAGFRKSKR
ncbi:thermonuclease family protein [Sutcliffiella halmapala]|uniref:thermonuclease family protein n=1 Tax=Sutcliffiella halmapala TaxID=79882 RepID=UPI00099540AB|nr:thermonuclease family protein [Sutcliffiella halmapala]